MKRIAILGSTGSIGENTLAVIRKFPGKFRVIALAARANAGLLCRQAKEFHPEFVCIGDARRSARVRNDLPRGTKLLIGLDGLLQICRDGRIDEVVMAISGAQALLPLLAAVAHKKAVALANKEALVMAGGFIMRKARESGATIIPVDSEQSAIWQCLQGQDARALKKIYLTASGGPFRGFDRNKLKAISISQALSHPRWKMGRKITVDSATLMNKGLEVFEAMHLFGLSPDAITVVVHPESIIHSMVEFIDGVVLAQLSVTDMRIPIQYALTYPERLASALPAVDFFKLGLIHFERPDGNSFPCLKLAYAAARASGTMPAVLSAANEMCVEGFLGGALSFTGIPRVIEKVLSCHRNTQRPALEEILNADAWAREEAKRRID